MIKDQYTTLPTEILLNTLLYSDINTIVNTCSIKSIQSYCDDAFWIEKFMYDKLPLIEQSEQSEKRTFNQWVKEYKNMYKAKTEAQIMIKILLYYNKYNNKFNFNIIYRYDNIDIIRLPDKLLQQITENMKDSIKFIFTYNESNDTWQYNIPYYNLYKITYDEIIYILTLALFDIKNNYNISVIDSKGHTLVYDYLLARVNGLLMTDVSRSYLMGYDIFKDYIAQK